MKNIGELESLGQFREFIEQVGLAFKIKNFNAIDQFSNPLALNNVHLQWEEKDEVKDTTNVFLRAQTFATTNEEGNHILGYKVVFTFKQRDFKTTVKGAFKHQSKHEWGHEGTYAGDFTGVGTISISEENSYGDNDEHTAIAKIYEKITKKEPVNVQKYVDTNLSSYEAIQKYALGKTPELKEKMNNIKKNWGGNPVYDKTYGVPPLMPNEHIQDDMACNLGQLSLNKEQMYKDAGLRLDPSKLNMKIPDKYEMKTNYDSSGNAFFEIVDKEQKKVIKLDSLGQVLSVKPLENP